MNVIFIFSFVLVFKFSVNLIRLFKTAYYHRKYRKYVDTAKRFGRNKNDKKINQCSASIGHLFYVAGTQQNIVVHKAWSITEYSDIITNQLDDLSNSDEILSRFERAKGVFKYRMAESFNPLYWIFLPLNILIRYNYSLPNFAKAIISVVFWIFSSVGAYVLEHFLDENIIFQELLHSLLQNF